MPISFQCVGSAAFRAEVGGCEITSFGGSTSSNSMVSISACKIASLGGVEGATWICFGFISVGIDAITTGMWSLGEV